ncbi:MAG: hypothetical protein GY747_13210 [Planctomycetes bacterium]|nr:hypothetical protein [Planctomycetota bacterium]MCP4772045.1 hypothetical protein [Planctomycetota bacterium]MCP4860305.1 hypothetical protein [Planctomycetota bacterium]
MFQNTLTRIFLVASLGLLASCGGGGLSSTSGSAGAGAGDGGNNGGGGTQFALADLDGNWAGEILPFLESRGDRNLILQMLTGNLLDASEGGGGDWEPGTASLDITFTVDGFLDLTLASVESGVLHLEGAMNLARNTINGTFTRNEPERTAYEGTFEIRLSDGGAAFTTALISGEWLGQALNSSDRFRLSQLEVDIDGNLIRAALTKPSSSVIVHHYLPAGNEGVFRLDNENIGLLQEVVLVATDGSTLTFSYLLINDEGTLMSGPGEDSVLGSGHVELSRPE